MKKNINIRKINRCLGKVHFTYTPIRKKILTNNLKYINILVVKNERRPTMTNKELLANKMNWILEEMNCSKTEFLKKCNFIDSISKPTFLNLFNKDNGKDMPSVDTLITIIRTCHMYGNERLKKVSFDFLLDNNYINLDRENLTIYEEIGLTNKTIEYLKTENTIGQFERDTLRGMNIFINKVKIWFFTYISYQDYIKDLIYAIEDRDISKAKKYLNIVKFKKFLCYSIPSFESEIKKFDQEQNIENLIRIMPYLDTINDKIHYYIYNCISDYLKDTDLDIYDIPLSNEEK